MSPPITAVLVLGIHSGQFVEPFPQGGKTDDNLLAGISLHPVLAAYKAEELFALSAGSVRHHPLHSSSIMPHLPSAPTHLGTTCRTWNRLHEIKVKKDLQLDGNSLDIASVVAVA